MYTVIVLNDLCETRVLQVTCGALGLVDPAVTHLLTTEGLMSGVDLETALTEAQDWEIVCIFEGTLKNLVH